MSNTVTGGAHGVAASLSTAPAVAPYSPPISDIVLDPVKMIARQQEIEAREIEILSSSPPGVLLKGAGPEVTIGIDAEWVFDPVTQSNRILSVQFHVVGECGEFQYIHYVRGDAKSDRPEFSALITKVILLAMEAGVVLEWPGLVIVVAFFLRADLTGFGDLARFKDQFDSVGRSVGTRGDGISFTSHLEPEDIERLTRAKRFIVHDEGRGRLLQVRFIDLVRHVPVGTTLADVGALLGQLKIDLPPGAIERMDQLLANDPELYAEYAAQDALIAAYYYHRLKESVSRLLGSDDVPLTSSGVAVKLFKKTLRDQRLDFRAVFGTEVKAEQFWNDKTGRLVTVKEDVPVPLRAAFSDFVIKTVHGGRGECFYVGPTPVGTLNDIDAASAYPVALSGIGLVDYANPRVCLDPEAYRGNTLGFALVRVKVCPGHVRFPVFPMEGAGQNLLFPRLGMSYCTADEIEVGLNLGYELEILHGVIFPWLDENTLPFQPFSTTIRDERAKYPKKSFDDEYIKLVGNGLTGKFGQGLREKRVFDAGEMKSVELEESSITSEIIFSHVTGKLRALMAELMNSVPRHRRVISVTTDGFLTDAPLAEIDQSGPVALRFKAAAERVAPGKPILEVKHRVSQILSARIRAQFTVQIDPDPTLPEEKRIVLAKGNVTPDIVLPDGVVTKPMIKALQNAYMVDLYLNRTPESKTVMRPFISLRQQWLDDLDVFRIERPVRLGLEFDMKRQPVNPRMESVGDGEHIAFDTVPWESMEAAEEARAVFAGWRRQRCLKTLEDWSHWQEFAGGTIKRRRHKANGGAGIKRTAEGEVGVLRRAFLRAYAQKAWGIRPTLSYANLATWLTSAGYPTTETEVKNAKRAKLSENVVSVNDEVIALLALLCEAFPSMEVERFVGQTDAARLKVPAQSRCN